MARQKRRGLGWIVLLLGLLPAAVWAGAGAGAQSLAPGAAPDSAGARLEITPGPLTKALLPLVANGEPPAGCEPNAQEQQIAQYMIDHPEQQRPSLTCHPILAQVARARAQDMADRHYFGHVNPDGFGPNYLVEQAGYDLPSYYGQAPDANNIESIAGGYATVDAAWQAWMNSSGHRTHILGLHPFFAEQIDYGIGYVYDPNSDYGHYWVVITAKPGP